ncbi:MAG: T6SS immunity protein Tdi1 domain-containing protein [Capsulimonadaceae bacterium]
MMRITIDDLIVDTGHLDLSTLLEDWRWLIGTTKVPILVSAIGDAFLQGRRDGRIYWLDVGEGRCYLLANSLGEFETLVRSKEFAMRVLAAGFIFRLRAAGERLGDGELYGFRLFPSQGGSYEVDNFAPADMEVHFSLTGQVYGQIRAAERRQRSHARPLARSAFQPAPWRAYSHYTAAVCPDRDESALVLNGR